MAWERAVRAYINCRYLKMGFIDRHQLQALYYMASQSYQNTFLLISINNISAIIAKGPHLSLKLDIKNSLKGSFPRPLEQHFNVIIFLSPTCMEVT